MKNLLYAALMLAALALFTFTAVKMGEGSVALAEINEDITCQVFLDSYSPEVQESVGGMLNYGFDRGFGIALHEVGIQPNPAYYTIGDLTQQFIGVCNDSPEITLGEALYAAYTSVTGR